MRVENYLPEVDKNIIFKILNIEPTPTIGFNLPVIGSNNQVLCEFQIYDINIDRKVRVSDELYNDIKAILNSKIHYILISDDPFSELYTHMLNENKDNIIEELNENRKI